MAGDSKPKVVRRRPTTPSPVASRAAGNASAKQISDTLAKWLAMGTLAYGAYVAAPLDLTDEQTEALAMDDAEAAAVAKPIGRIMERTLPAAINRGFIASDDWLEAGVALMFYGRRVAPTARQAAAVRASRRPAQQVRTRKETHRAAQPASQAPENVYPGSGPVAGTAGGYGLGVQHNPDL